MLATRFECVSGTPCINMTMSRRKVVQLACDWNNNNYYYDNDSVNDSVNDNDNHDQDECNNTAKQY